MELLSSGELFLLRSQAFLLAPTASPESTFALSYNTQLIVKALLSLLCCGPQYAWRGDNAVLKAVFAQLRWSPLGA